ncbi:MAG TPA: class I SAM-dependent methyltransferase [Vicinamibacteria bacterium]
MSLDRLQEHRAIWAGKPVLADVYRVWFDALLEGLPRGSRVLELGAGPGFLAEHARRYREDVAWVASDLVRVPWNDLVADGLSLPLREGSLDAIVALDFVHHVARPGRLFEEAARVLRAGGRVSMVEPWVTPFSYPVYRFLHEEGCRLSLDPWNPFPAARSADKEPFEGDGAVPFRLVRDTPAARWAALGFSTPRATPLNGFAYLASLGFKRGSLGGRRVSTALRRLDAALAPLASVVGMRALLRWERQG